MADTGAKIGGNLISRVGEDLFYPHKQPSVAKSLTPMPTTPKADDSLIAPEEDPLLVMQKKAQKALGTQQLVVGILQPGNVNTP